MQPPQLRTATNTANTTKHIQMQVSAAVSSTESSRSLNNNRRRGVRSPTSLLHERLLFLALELVAQLLLLLAQLLELVVVQSPIGVSLGAQLISPLLCDVDLRVQRIDLLLDCCELMLDRCER